jgi:hypothetical protein
VARTKVSYAEAVRLLLGAPDPVDIAGRVAGTAMLAAIPFNTDTVLGWFDAKGEANNLLRDLLGRAPARIRAARGKRHHELIEAAHGVLVLSAFFDAVKGPQLAALKLTDDEKLSMLGDPAPMPGATCGFLENLPMVAAELGEMARSFRNFVRGLAAGRDMPDLDDDDVVDRAVEIYRERYVQLAADVPELAIWSQLDEHAATRTEIRQTLASLTEMLARIVDAPSPATVAEQRLAGHAAEALRQPIWQAETEDISFPTVEQGFVSPRFRLAEAHKDSRLADDGWWEEQGERDDLTGFLTGYLTDPASTERPLVILGSPGAGKSLVTKILAARLPANVFTTFRVPLRAVDPDAEIYRQVEDTTERLIHQRMSWADLCDASDTTKVVLLDGFDELIQATGVIQSSYLDRVARFQQQEWINGHAVAAVVTSRTLVMDRTAVPEGTLVIKLEPFDDQQIAQWTDVWNTANTRQLAPDQLQAHRDLAEQPLLLLMLAIYAASSDAPLSAGLSTEDLYGRLLDSFIRRQIRGKAEADLAEEVLDRRERESRRDLATVAFAMFNRGHQWVGETELDEDLRALEQGGGSAGSVSSRSVTPAQRTIAGFFFVHTAHTPGRRTFEFMHATFGEYLIAEQTFVLLRELAEDWRRSRGRGYGPSLDDRVLRALLSHQPLSRRDRILPFLASLIGEMDEREDLRSALIELYRGSRKPFADDPYRPTPFDVIGRVAAYTANLVLLLALCSPDGMPVAQLSGGPGLDSTVRLWRSGLDREAQQSIFDVLTRVDDVLWPWRPTDRLTSLPVAEAQLTGDRLADLVLMTGEELLQKAADDSPIEVTPVQRELHLLVVQIIAARWPAPQFDRMMPYDEQLYVNVAELAEGADEPPLAQTAFLLARTLTDDARRLPIELVERLVTAVFRPEVTADAQPMLTVLALTRPELLTGHPELADAAVDSPTPAFVYEALLAAGLPELADVIELLARRLAHRGDPTRVGASALPSMLRNLRFAPHQLAPVIRTLSGYGAIAWEQVRPSDMLAAVDALGPADESLNEALVSYIAARIRDEFDDEDAVAIAQLRDRFV